MKIVAIVGSVLSMLDGSSEAPQPVCSLPGRNPVVLVHGILANESDMLRMRNYLRKQGWQVYTPTITPGNGSMVFEEQGQMLADYIRREIGEQSFDLVGFSMGGLLCRYYVQRLDVSRKVQRLVTLAAPHHGVAAAGAMSRAAIVQMRPGSEFLKELERDVSQLSRVQFTSVRTPLDLVVPSRSSIMPMARNVRIWTATHPGLVLSSRSCRVVAARLAEPLATEPGAKSGKADR